MKENRVAKFVALTCFVVGFFMCINPAHATEFSVDLQLDDVFTVGDEIRFTYEIRSDEQVDISYVAGVECASYPIPPLEIHTGIVGPGTSISGEFTLGTVDETTVPEECEARVTVIEPVEYEATSQFRIDAVEVPLIVLMTCKDEECAVPSKTFTLGESVYLSLEAGDASVSVTVTSPEGSISEVSVPGTYVPGEAGTYAVVLSGDSTAYRLSESPYNFAVVDEKSSMRLLTGEEDYVDMGAGDQLEGQSLVERVRQAIENDQNILVAAFLAVGILTGMIAIILHRRERSLKK